MGIHAHTPLLVADTKIAPAAVEAGAIIWLNVDSTFCLSCRLSEMNLIKYYSKIVTIGRQRSEVGLSPSRRVFAVVTLPDCTLKVWTYLLSGTVLVA